MQKTSVTAGLKCAPDRCPNADTITPSTTAWADAMKEFHDQTGQPGPALWSGGHYTVGEADEPVRGVSWYEDDAFAPLFPSHGRPAEAPWRLALVSVLQFAEGLSDRQAAEAVRRLEGGARLDAPRLAHRRLC